MSFGPQSATMKALVLLVSALFLPLLTADTTSTDITCKIIWVFKESCAKPNQALVQQVESWSSKKCADEQEKCMYEVVKSSPSNLNVKHTSKRTHKVTEMSFTFTPPESPQFCKIYAFSVTSPKNGTSPNDFCLFHNLIQASGLFKDPGFKEISNEKICPSKETAKCISKDKF